MPPKRKVSNIKPNVIYAKIPNPAPHKLGKLKSILKKPSSEHHFVIHSSPVRASIALSEPRAISNAQKAVQGATSATPRTAKGHNLGTVPSVKTTNPAAVRPALPYEHNLDVIEYSATEAELPSLPRRRLISPRYEDDGDTEGLVRDSQAQVSDSDDTHFMSGGLGAGESPYKVPSSSTSVETSDRGNKRRKRSFDSPSLIGVPTSETRNASFAAENDNDQPDEPLTLARAQPPDSPPSDVLKSGASTAEPKTDVNQEAKSGIPSSPPRSGIVPLISPKTTESEQKASRMIFNSNTDVPATAVKVPASIKNGCPTPASPRVSRSQRRKATKRQSPELADVSKMLQQYGKTCEAENRDLRKALESALAKATQLEAQNHLLQREFASRSQKRQLQYTWHLNKFAVFSRRKYALQREEETRVVGGFDDLNSANELAYSLFQGEMTKLETVVENLGRSNLFGNIEIGMPQVQLRYTACGMVKCRACYPFPLSWWDLTVERVAAN